MDNNADQNQIDYSRYQIIKNFVGKIEAYYINKDEVKVLLKKYTIEDIVNGYFIYDIQLGLKKQDVIDQNITPKKFIVDQLFLKHMKEII